MSAPLVRLKADHLVPHEFENSCAGLSHKPLVIHQQYLLPGKTRSLCFSLAQQRILFNLGLAHAEFGPFYRLALESNPNSMFFQDALGNGKPQCHLWIGLVLKEPSLLFISFD